MNKHNSFSCFHNLQRYNSILHDYTDMTWHQWLYWNTGIPESTRRHC